MNPSSDRKLSRRGLLHSGVVLASSSLLAATNVQAQGTFPSRPIKVIIGTPPGDTADGWIRILAEMMARSLGQPVVVENKPGAHWVIAAGLAKAAAPDGYTLLAGTGGPMAVNPALYRGKLSYDPQKDFTPIAPVLSGALFLYCRQDLPVQNLRDMIAWVKERPGLVSYGSGGTGTTQHLSMELLKAATGLQMTHVPYRGSPMVLTDVIGGQIPFAFDAGGSLLPHVKAGRVRVIGVTGTQRDPSLPDAPTLAEQGVSGINSRVWMGMFAPANTPSEIVARLGDVINRVATTQEFASRLTASASVPWIGRSNDLRQFLVSDTEAWSRVVEQGNIKPE